jgi:uncharacterized protein
MPAIKSGAYGRAVSKDCHINNNREWPEASLTSRWAEDNGWRRIPIQEFIIKLSGRCNLACDYCYIYTMADQSWRGRPKQISARTLKQVSARLAEHAEEHCLPSVRVVLHGGEPLLAGLDLIDYTASVIRKDLDAGTDLEMSMQTNGALLDERAMRVMHAHSIRIGLSLDGAEHHNRRRKFANGRISYPSVVRALSLLTEAEHRRLFAGLLCTVDLSNDPVEVYEALARFAPPMLDILLPHANWSSPPPQAEDGNLTPYARWLIQMFDRWAGDRYSNIRIRLFEDIIRLVLGGSNSSDQIGLSPAAFLVVDTDGSLQQTDTLKSAYAGAPDTGLNVFDHAVDDALIHPAVIARQLGRLALADECLQCPVVGVCGGGHYSHRYRRGSGFRNPSVYCSDLQALIDHVAAEVHAGIV